MIYNLKQLYIPELAFAYCVQNWYGFPCDLLRIKDMQEYAQNAQINDFNTL
jgi:hypothetical protein